VIVRATVLLCSVRLLGDIVMTTTTTDIVRDLVRCSAEADSGTFTPATGNIFVAELPPVVTDVLCVSERAGGTGVGSGVGNGVGIGVPRTVRFGSGVLQGGCTHHASPSAQRSQLGPVQLSAHALQPHSAVSSSVDVVGFNVTPASGAAWPPQSPPMFAALHVAAKSSLMSEPPVGSPADGRTAGAVSLHGAGPHQANPAAHSSHRVLAHPTGHGDGVVALGAHSQRYVKSRPAGERRCGHAIVTVENRNSFSEEPVGTVQLHSPPAMDVTVAAGLTRTWKSGPGHRIVQWHARSENQYMRSPRPAPAMSVLALPLSAVLLLL